MSSLGIFNKETKTYQKVAGTAEAAVLDAEMSDTSTNTVQNKVIKKYVDDSNTKKLDKTSVVNNHLTSEEGYALDARQANPNVEGSLGAQIKTVNETVDAKTKEIEENLSQLSNPNLLINPDFRINQRGGKIVESGKNYYSDESCGTLVGTTTSAYTATRISNGNYSISIDGTTYYVKVEDVVDGYCEIGYTVDRWRIIDESARLIKKNKGIHLSYSQRGQIRQTFEEELEGTFTLSAKFSDNNGASVFEIQLFNSEGWAQFPNGYITTTETSGILKTTFTGKVLGVVLRASSANIEWVKLELGSVATPFIPPDPATELAKCQRYYEKGHGYYNSAVASVGAIAVSNIEFKATKRITPTISLTLHEGNCGGINLDQGLSYQFTNTKNVQALATSTNLSPYFGYAFVADAEIY